MKKILPKLKAKIKEFKKEQSRLSAIEREEIFAGKFPVWLKLIVLVVVIALVFTFAISIITNLEERLWIPSILTAQLIFIIVQLWFIKNQTKYFKITHQPEFILKTFRFNLALKGPNYTRISVVNIGETAHRVTLNIKTDRKKSLKFLNDSYYKNLYTIKQNQEKEGCSITTDDFKNKKLVVKLEYQDKAGNWSEAVFLKLSKEEDFIPIFTGLE
jgi:hypothetical protein